MCMCSDEAREQAGRVSVWFLALVAILAMFSGCGTGPASYAGQSSSAEASKRTVSIDFQNQSNKQFPVPNDFVSTEQGSFGSQLAGAMSMISEAGINLIRIDSGLASVYATKAPDWTSVDDQLAVLQANGMHAIVIIWGTPPWLTPEPDLCVSRGSYPAHSVPTDLNAWSQLAASFVAHVDQHFPGVVKYYEIWNEPDLEGFLCSLPVSTDETRMEAYANIYVAAARAMKAQAKADGAEIRIGGPAMSNILPTENLLAQFVGNPQASPYIDFISYHYYVEPAQYNWGDPIIGLLAKSLGAGFGFASGYNDVYQQVARGLRPSAELTPIMITEYNDSPDFGTNCCRNSPVYSPLFNSIAVSELLNSVYRGVPQVPATLSYFGARSYYSSFCLLGTVGTDCSWSGGRLDAFPQYYAFQLISSPKYLGLSSGTYLIPSRPSLPDGIIGSAFYNASSCSLLLINPTDKVYSQTEILFSNVAIPASRATMFLLNENNPNITISSLPLSHLSPQIYYATVDLPPNSVVGLKLE